jgi:hypothetical protein
MIQVVLTAAMECGSRFSKGYQVSSVVSHTTFKKETPSRNSWLIILLTSYSEDDSPATAKFNGVGGGELKFDCELYRRTVFKILWSRGKHYRVYLKYGS